MANAAGIKAGRAYVQLGTDDTQLQKGLKQAERHVVAFGRAVGRIGTQLGGLGAAITGSLLAAAKEFADTGSALNDMSDRTGVSVERLSELSFAAKQSGTDLETVEGAVKKMQKALVAGTDESAAAAGAFDMLGLSVQKLMGMSPADQFQTIARRIAAVRDPTARAAAAMAVFGKSGTALLPMIADLDALTEKARKLGLVWTAEEAKRADALGDSIDLLTASFKRVVAVIGSAVAPILTELAGEIASGAKVAMDFVKANEALIVVALKAGAGLVALGGALGGLHLASVAASLALGGMRSAVGLLVSALGLLATPLGGLLVGMALTTTAMGKWGEAAAIASDLVKTNFGDMLKTAQDTFAGMSDALKAGDITLAAKVLFAGLNVEFLEGTVKLAKIWNDWGVGLVESFRKVNFEIANLLIDFEGLFKSTFANIVAHLKQSDIVGALGEIFKALAPATAQDAIARAAGIPGPQDAIIGALGGKPGIQAPPGAQAGIAKDLADKQDALRAAQAIEEEARRKAAAAALNKAQDDLFQAEIELAKHKKEAADKAAEKALEPEEASGQGGMGGQGGGGMTPEGLDKGLKEAAAKVDVTGSFSAAAAAGLGVGSTIDKQQLDESKKQTSELEKVNKKLDKRAVFAD